MIKNHNLFFYLLSLCNTSAVIRLDGRVVMQRPAKPFTPVRFRLQPPDIIMKIGIVGFGFVGQALKKGLEDDVECIVIDPKLKTYINDLQEFNLIWFICVPTPMNDDGSQNIQIVNDVIEEINKFDSNLLIILKSTILPKYVKKKFVKI